MEHPNRNRIWWLNRSRMNVTLFANSTDRPSSARIPAIIITINFPSQRRNSRPRARNAQMNYGLRVREFVGACEYATLKRRCEGENSSIDFVDERRTMHIPFCIHSWSRILMPIYGSDAKLNKYKLKMVNVNRTECRRLCGLKLINFLSHLCVGEQVHAVALGFNELYDFRNHFKWTRCHPVLLLSPLSLTRLAPYGLPNDSEANAMN